MSRLNGWFAFTSVTPGRYHLLAIAIGFATALLCDFALNVDQRVLANSELGCGAIYDAVTVSAEAPRLVKTDGSVGTVIDRQFVENLPLNGRSVQALLEIMPGVVLTNPPSASGDQFSVNGQRASPNCLMIDGVSADTRTKHASRLTGRASSGQYPALRAFGGTDGLVSVDALQEFRIQTSSYAPEFGRTPGGQVSLVTRPGTNGFHGSVFELLGDERLGANDWFTNRRELPKRERIQHRFGGVIGGPAQGTQTFVFDSYEQLRLHLPQVVRATVPTIDTRRYESGPRVDTSQLSDRRTVRRESYSDIRVVLTTGPPQVKYSRGLRRMDQCCSATASPLVKCALPQNRTRRWVGLCTLPKVEATRLRHAQAERWFNITCQEWAYLPPGARHISCTDKTLSTSKVGVVRDVGSAVIRRGSGMNSVAWQQKRAVLSGVRSGVIWNRPLGRLPGIPICHHCLELRPGESRQRRLRSEPQQWHDKTIHRRALHSPSDGIPAPRIAYTVDRLITQLSQRALCPWSTTRRQRAI
jgi:hypothetical protein